MSTAKQIMEGIKVNWEKHYNNSSVQIQDWELQEIRCPRQENSFDCSIFMMYNVEHWDSIHVLEYGQKGILSMRKILTAKMVKSDHNDLNWAKMLNIKKDRHKTIAQRYTFQIQTACLQQLVYNLILQEGVAGKKQVHGV